MNHNLENAIIIIGGTTKTAKLCGVTPRAVNLWVQMGGIPTTVHAIAVADAAGVFIRDLAPPRIPPPAAPNAQ
jgi:DNA-binding transcriptional regulator YdaS (Cro superfamily)